MQLSGTVTPFVLTNASHSYLILNWTATSTNTSIAGGFTLAILISTANDSDGCAQLVVKLLLPDTVGVHQVECATFRVVPLA